VIGDGGSGSTSRNWGNYRSEQPDDALSLPSPRFEKIHHRIVIDGLADECPTDERREVVVPDRNRIRIAVGALTYFRRRPDPDTWQ